MRDGKGNEGNGKRDGRVKEGNRERKGGGKGRAKKVV